MTQLDRFPPPDEPRVSAVCAYCGGEIYVGDTLVLYANNDTSHEGECESGYIAAELGLERLVAE
ncbi:hypothetical protein [Paenibacillus sp. FSL K6-2859]|uniref:hypothetical protein n=1 Tax=Paenibacillus sp. FSL K6-2859 TaxID=2921482 RepID=UPI0030F82579